MMDSNDTIYEVIGIDSEDSSSSSTSAPVGSFSIFKSLVLEVHDMKKDDAEPPTNANQTLPGIRVKKIKKKKNPATKTVVSDSVESLSSDTPTVTKQERIEEGNKEEFYDAHESYHTLAENQSAAVSAAAALPSAAAPVVGANLVVAQSITGQELLKLPAADTDEQLDQGQNVEERQPSTISKRPEK